MSDITIEQFQRVLPNKSRINVTQNMVDAINNISSNDQFREMYRDNLLGYASVMKDGKFQIQKYIDAVRYVTFKVMGDSNIEAYTKTFPDRYQRMLQDGISQKDIASMVAAYNKAKLVNLIFEQTLIPSHVLNADIYQKAINTQAELMLTANSEKVRAEAANSLLTHLKPPETKKVELDIGIKEGSVIDDLRNATAALARQQREALEAGATSAEQVAHSKIVGEVVDAEFEEVPADG